MLALAAAACLVCSPAQAQAPQAIQIIGGDAHAQRCVQAALSGDTSDRAVEECTRALRYPHLSSSGAQQITINRGVIRLRRSEFDLALADFDTAVGQNTNNAEAHLNRGTALLQLRRYGEAIAAFTTAMSLGVAEPHKAYFNRGAARESLGDLRGAYEDYSTALEIQPDWGPANAELARFARGRRDHLATVLDSQATP
ncbi:MAG TPA: tetratricopeptide repeat protein [Candidatus Binatia bacterium]|nr:tetratricopeptide repeat protein [Candidatus Binatia bacterium]